MAAKQLAARAADAPDDDDDAAIDVDAMRSDIALRLHRVIADLLQYWRDCDQRTCRRGRKCCAPRPVCAGRDMATPVEPEQLARTMAQFQRMVRERLDQLDAEAEQRQIADRTHKKS